MDRVTFTPPDIRTLRLAARFLRGKELQLPDAAHSKTHEAVLMSALWLDHEADELGAAPQLPSRETRRPIFNHLVAPLAGGPVYPDQAKAMLDAHEVAVQAETIDGVDKRLAAMTLPEHLKGTFNAGSYADAWRHCRNVVQEMAAALGSTPGTAAEVELLRVKGAMLALHPKTANPRHGCCAPPTSCRGHVAECRSSEHNLACPAWPCKSLRAVGIASDADAEAVRQALAALEKATDPEGYPSRKKTNRGRTVHATRQTDDGIGDAGACGMYFPRDTESTLEAPDTEVSCQACVKALLRKREEAAAAVEDAHRCTLPPTRRLACGCCPHQVCEDCERCAHTCECGTGGTPAQ